MRRSARILAVEIADEAAEEISRRSRGTPRVANRILRRVRDVAEVRHEGAVTAGIAHEALDLLEVDEHGLERSDRALLEAIVEKFGGGPVGLSTLAVALGEEPDTIEDVYEPYLLQLGFIQRTPRGRIVTELGRAHVGAAAARRASTARCSSARAVDPRGGRAVDRRDFVERVLRPDRRGSRRSSRAARHRSRVELRDGSVIPLESILPEPGFGFVTLRPHTAPGEEIVVPVGAIARLSLAPPERHPPFGFSKPPPE